MELTSSQFSLPNKTKQKN